MKPLERYRKMRDFRATPEPSGGKRSRGANAQKPGLSFVVQKHAARRLHYDFRLEFGGVLWSWAVPKGPSLDPKDRRLAVRTEDHPLEYAKFEGVIPEKHYGAGKVEIWDHGTWTPEGEPEAMLRGGHLTFSLRGERLNGRFHLEKLKDRDGAKENWLLIKSRHDAPELENGDGLAKKSAPPAAAPRRWHKSEARSSGKSDVELATLVAAPPDGDDWIHETKFDGYRALMKVASGRCRVVTRGGHDWTNRFESLAHAIESLGVKDAMIDGEIVAIDEHGRSSFQLLQAFLSADSQRVGPVYFAFDLLEKDGDDLRGLPLLQRKKELARIVGRRKKGFVRFSDHVAGHGSETFREACRLGLEGIVSKRADSMYHAGRGTDWQKAKCIQRQEFVIGGFTEPKGSRQAFGALLVGVMQDGKLEYSGKVGTGFDDVRIREIGALLKRSETSKSPFATPPREQAVHWTKPSLVCEVAFTEWTRDGRLRHPSFQGMREDKDPRSIVREVPRDVASKPREPADKEREKRPGKPASKAAAKTSRAPNRAKPAKGNSTASVIAAITHPDKILYPKTGTTKGEVARYLEAVAPRMLPHVAGRPLALVRCPNGVGAKCFFQKHLEGQELVTVNDAAQLVGLVQLGVLEIHVWGSKIETLERPDVMVFDFDPAPDVGWPAVVRAAIALKEMLEERRGLRTFAKLTGGKGVHVVVPTDPDHDWDTHKAVAKAVADELAATDPDRFTTNPRKDKRGGKIFIDYLRNGRGATAIAPYSLRAREGASVAVPIAWSELTPRLKPDGITIEDAMRRARGRDSWQGYPL